MLSEMEAVNNFDKAVSVSWILTFQSFKDFYFNLSIFNVKFFISTNLNSHFPTSFFIINTPYNLTKSSFIYNITHLIPIPYLFSYLCMIVTFFVSYFLQSLTSVTSHRINIIELT